MAISKVIYDDRVLIDLTGDTVTADTLLEGVTAHSASGETLAGAYKPSGAPTSLIGTFEPFDDWTGIVAAVDMSALTGTFELEDET